MFSRRGFFALRVSTVAELERRAVTIGACGAGFGFGGLAALALGLRAASAYAMAGGVSLAAVAIGRLATR